MPNVEIKIHGRTVDTIALGDLPLTIGRDAQAEITIPDQAVSRRHAVLERDGAEVWRIRDLKSRNGTYVDGMRVDLAPLEHGCLIHVGSCCLIFHHALSETEEAPVAGPTLATVETASKVKTLGELPAPKLSTERVRAVIDFAARMMREQETLRRMRMLCELLVASTFPAEQAVVVRSEAEGPIETVTECIGACRAGMVRRPDEPL